MRSCNPSSIPLLNLRPIHGVGNFGANNDLTSTAANVHLVVLSVFSGDPKKGQATSPWQWANVQLQKVVNAGHIFMLNDLFRLARLHWPDPGFTACINSEILALQQGTMHAAEFLSLFEAKVLEYEDGASNIMPKRDQATHFLFASVTRGACMLGFRRENADAQTRQCEHWIACAGEWQIEHPINRCSEWIRISSVKHTCPWCYNCSLGGHFADDCVNTRVSPNQVAVSSIAQFFDIGPSGREADNVLKLESDNQQVHPLAAPSQLETLGCSRGDLSPSVVSDAGPLHTPFGGPRALLAATVGVKSKEGIKHFVDVGAVSLLKEQKLADGIPSASCTEPRIMQVKNVLLWTTPSGCTLQCLLDSGAEIDVIDSHVVRAESSFVLSSLVAPLHLCLGTGNATNLSSSRAIMLSTPSSDMNDLKTILQQLLQARLSDT
ncbi:BQ2448_7133 [Microbotryum intermedium]|uniref:BQ2448_7133 protein n=1 Tax=Microbotryum intermedium TaxID=269621 RepID=A0A238FPS4_9BASI|nr:BQ2448_7133 [Microbotryum intermedium]